MSFTALVTTVAAVAALWFTGQSLRATNNQYDLAQQTALTDRFQKAAELLSSESADTRIAAVYLFERLMQDSPKDHPVILSVLTSFLRTRSSAADCDRKATPDVQVALTVVGRRQTGRDTERVNLEGACLAGRIFANTHFAKASFRGTNLAGAILDRGDLAGADFLETDLSRSSIDATTVLEGAEFAGLSASDLTGADLSGADLTGVYYDRSTVWPAGFTPPPSRGAR
ncbi:pentapeptide repeat-containing protein [Nocardia yamanashiensis]|uniref:pentapeptide repeat-containing protein n=1 Tax=Nocardia yamanashiensis TaxID=209247 RepID=UPI00082FF51B|nr:pentapeptide repeat-containing protein [Nocardia yamanashiensis]